MHLRIAFPLFAAILPALFLSACKGAAAPADPSAALTDIRLRCAQEPMTQSCLQQAVVDAATSDGPELATMMLDALIAERDLQPGSDYHDLSHKIGRATAKALGVIPDAFLRCPSSFNYGCQHGFFEQALVTEPDAVAAARRICDAKAFEDRAEKSLFYCFHGVGHGILMANAYDLHGALATCDAFDGQQREGCWQGVFMENVNGALKGEAPPGIFSILDPLAPCNGIEPQYRWQCYINHAAYLVGQTGYSVEGATAACLKAEEADRPACLESVGLMATNPGWQQSLLRGVEGTLEENAAAFCARYPPGYEDVCIRAAVDNLQNFDQASTERSARFCGLLAEGLRTPCYTRIGIAVRNELPPGQKDISVCDAIPAAYRSLCLSPLQS